MYRNEQNYQYQNPQQPYQMQQPSGQQSRMAGPEFNDRDRAQDLLSTEKYLSWAFDTSAFESGPRELHNTRTQILGEIHGLQRQVFEEMFQRGWYELKSADQNEISQTDQEFSRYRTQLPYSGQSTGQAR